MIRHRLVRRAARTAACAGATAVALVGWSPALTAQGPGIRLRGVTTTRYLELDRFEDDSVRADHTLDADRLYRRTPEGRVVLCEPGREYCVFKRSGPRINTVPVTQDLQVTAWGFGEGLSVHADVRGRGAGGSAPELWPRAGDRFDVLSGYLQYDRSRITARLGRQFVSNGMGVYNFDGAMLQARPWRGVTVDGWGGWSLVRGINEGYTSAELAVIEELAPDRPALIVGTSMRVRPSRGSAFRMMYQREVRENRSGLYSERIAADGTVRLGRGAMDASYEQDLASGQINEARLRWRGELPLGFEASVEGRRFRPFFELWTIWGAFAPVGFDEMRVDGGWSTPDHRLSVDLFGGYRQWADAGTGLEFQPLRSTGWRAGGDLTARLTESIVASGHYDADVGAGASREEVDIGLRYEGGQRWFVGVSGTAMQSLFEFRIGTGRMLGYGFDAGWRVTRDVRLVADVMAYQHRGDEGTPFTNWSQRRGSVRLEWTMGTDPGLRGVERAP
jgi:hypothetical protein